MAAVQNLYSVFNSPLISEARLHLVLRVSTVLSTFHCRLQFILKVSDERRIKAIVTERV